MFPYKCHLTQRLTSLNRFIYLKYFHASLSNHKKTPNKKLTLQSDSKNKIKNFSFIQVNEKRKNSFDFSDENTDNSENVRSVVNDLIKQQESIANKIAKLIDKLEPSKTVERLLETTKEIQKSKQITPIKTGNKKHSESITINMEVNQNKELKIKKIVSQSEKNKKNVITKEETKREPKSDLIIKSLTEETKTSKPTLREIVERTRKMKKEPIKKIKIIQDEPDTQLDLEMISKSEENFQKNEIYFKIHNLSSGTGLDLFNKLKQTEIVPTKESSIWSIYYDDELKKAQDTLPINGFDEMIMLTNEGKLWKFPIDNEQDIDEKEAQIPFYEHVFLDSYLDEFPQIESIQDFMTLALNGLSQNSFLSLNEKKEIIQWYKTYFNEKEDLIKEALESEKIEADYKQSLSKHK